MAKKDLRRKPGSRAPKDRIFILTEGEATEIEYFREVCNRLGLPKELVIIKKARASQGKRIVDELVEEKRANARLVRKGNDTLIDQWWAVCDTEGRPQDLGGAIQKARDNGVFLAISDPSFEYWLRLHFGYTTASYDSVAKLMKELREGDRLPEYNERNKHPDMNKLYPLLPEAMKNARLVRDNHTKIGNGQPRTDCDLLLDAIAMQCRTTKPSFDQKAFDSSNLSMNIC